MMKKKLSTGAVSTRVNKRRGGIDIPFFVIVMLLLAFGLIMVLSSSYASAYYIHGDSLFFAKKQFIYALVGLFLMGVCVTMDYKWLKLVSLPMLAGSFLLLILVLTPLGSEYNGAQRWLFGLQPSEVTKLATVVFFAHCISNYPERIRTIKGLAPYLIVLAATAGLLILEPHFSATIMICAVGMIMIFVGGAPVMPFAIAGGLGATGVAVILLFTDYAKSRLDNWLHPELDPLGKGYQILQSLYAIGSGGLLGLGFGQSRQKYLYIPEPQNDFIFAIVCEELGYVGALLVLALFVLLIWRGFSIAFRAPDKFGTMLVVGIISLVAVQFILNIAVVTNTIPTTGIPLPFFSAGGTALVMLLVEMGIVLNVSRYCNK